MLPKKIDWNLIIGVVAIIIMIIIGTIQIIISIKHETIRAKNEIKKDFDEKTKFIESKLSPILQKVNTYKFREAEMYFFDNKLSSLRIIKIDTINKNVKVQFNIRGENINEVLVINKGRLIYVDKEEKIGYSFILTGVSSIDKTGEFVINQI